MDFVSAAREAQDRDNSVWHLSTDGYVAATDAEAQRRAEQGQGLTEVLDWREQLKSYE